MKIFHNKKMLHDHDGGAAGRSGERADSLQKAETGGRVPATTSTPSSLSFMKPPI
jgi:hypothetical protein